MQLIFDIIYSVNGAICAKEMFKVKRWLISLFSVLSILFSVSFIYSLVVHHILAIMDLIFSIASISIVYLLKTRG